MRAAEARARADEMKEVELRQSCSGSPLTMKNLPSGPKRTQYLGGTKRGEQQVGPKDRGELCEVAGLAAQELSAATTGVTEPAGIPLTSDNLEI
jgi:hypothetical protein